MDVLEPELNGVAAVREIPVDSLPRPLSDDRTR